MAAVKLKRRVQMVEQVTITKAMIEAGKTVLGHMICEDCPYDILAKLVYERMRPLEPTLKRLVKP